MTTPEDLHKNGFEQNAWNLRSETEMTRFYPESATTPGFIYWLKLSVELRIHQPQYKV